MDRLIATIGFGCVTYLYALLFIQQLINGFYGNIVSRSA